MGGRKGISARLSIGIRMTIGRELVSIWNYDMRQKCELASGSVVKAFG